LKKDLKGETVYSCDVKEIEREHNETDSSLKQIMTGHLNDVVQLLSTKKKKKSASGAASTKTQGNKRAKSNDSDNDDDDDDQAGNQNDVETAAAAAPSSKMQRLLQHPHAGTVTAQQGTTASTTATTTTTSSGIHHINHPSKLYGGMPNMPASSSHLFKGNGLPMGYHHASAPNPSAPSLLQNHLFHNNKWNNAQHMFSHIYATAFSNDMLPNRGAMMHPSALKLQQQQQQQQHQAEQQTTQQQDTSLVLAPILANDLGEPEVSNGLQEEIVKIEEKLNVEKKLNLSYVLN